MLGSRARRAFVATATAAFMISGLAITAFASTDATGSPPAGDVYYEADCTITLSPGVVAPYLIGLNINATPDDIAPTGAHFGAAGTVDLPIIGPVVAGIAAVGFIGTMFGAQADFTIGSTDGTATGTFVYSHVFPKVPVGTVGTPGRQVTKVMYTLGSTTLSSVAAQFDPTDVGMSVAYTNLGDPTDQRIDPTAVITAVALDKKSVTISLPTLKASAALGDSLGLGRTVSFSDSTLSTGPVFTTAGSPNGQANIGVISVKDVIENAALALTFGGTPGVGASNCLETGWGEPGDVPGPLQLGTPPLVKPQLPVPPATGSASALVLATGGFLAQPGTSQKITPPTAAHVTLNAGGGTTTLGTDTTTTTVAGTTTTTGATTTTTVPAGPTLSISDASAIRPDSGTAKMTFVVTLSAPLTHALSVHYATQDNTAHQPNDYKAKTGSLRIGKGHTAGSINITITGGIIGQTARTFFVNLSNPGSGATISDGQGIGTIVDLHLPGIILSDASAPVPASRTSTMIFNVTLTKPPTARHTCKIPYSTQDATGLAGVDYKAKHGTLQIGVGKTSGQIKITILSTGTPGNIFVVQVGGPTNCVIDDGLAIGTLT